MLLFLEVVIRVFEVFRAVLASVSVHTRLKSFLIVVNFLLVFFRVMRDVSFVFKLLLNPSEFNSALVRSLEEELLGVREGVDDFEQVFLL